MLTNDIQVDNRLSSPDNLINKLRRATQNSENKSLSIFGVRQNTNDVSIPSIPSAEELVDNLDTKLQAGRIHKKATDVMEAALNELEIQLSSIARPEKLATIAKDMHSIIQQKDDRKNNSPVEVHVWMPEMKKIEHYDIIECN